MQRMCAGALQPSSTAIQLLNGVQSWHATGSRQAVHMPWGPTATVQAVARVACCLAKSLIRQGKGGEPREGEQGTSQGGGILETRAKAGRAAYMGRWVPLTCMKKSTGKGWNPGLEPSKTMKMTAGSHPKLACSGQACRWSASVHAAPSADRHSCVRLVQCGIDNNLMNSWTLEQIQEAHAFPLQAQPQVQSRTSGTVLPVPQAYKVAAAPCAAGSGLSC